jgi:hypothetical protein
MFQKSVETKNLEDESIFLNQVEDTVLPLLWFDEGLDELGQDLIDVIGQAVLDPPVYKNYLLCVFLGECDYSTQASKLISCN